MDAQDVKNGNLSLSRLETAKKAILDYINIHTENRYGIILFAGKSLISSPLTTDTQVLSDIIGSLDTKSIREGGTNIEDALNLSIKRFSSATGALDNKNNKTLVLLTDGGETDDIPSWEKI
jgi:Ca-activated chloride channel family protein